MKNAGIEDNKSPTAKRLLKVPYKERNKQLPDRHSSWQVCGGAVAGGRAEQGVARDQSMVAEGEGIL